jgi:hypothetical protein
LGLVLDSEAASTGVALVLTDRISPAPGRATGAATQAPKAEGLALTSPVNF